MRTPLSLLPLALLVAPPALAAESVDELAATALAANPSLEALVAREAELRARAGAAGAWPDPVLGIEYSNAPVSSLSIADHPMAGLQFRAQQMLKPPGWSGAAREVVELGADAVAQDRAEAELQLDASVRRAWWTLTQVRLLEGVTEEHLARAEELLDVVRARYVVGGAGQSAVLRLEVLRDRLRDDLGEYRRDDRSLTAALNEALARDGGGFETAAELSPLDPPDERNWAALALEHRPAFAAIDARVRADEAGADLARLDAWPDPSIWVGYRMRTVETETDPGVDMVSIGLGIPIPTGSGRRADAERAARLEAARAGRARFASTEDAAVADMEAAMARWTRSWEKANTYGDALIPAARDTLETTLADYTVDKASFSDLFDAEVTLLNLERAWITAAVDTHLQQVNATAILGVSPGDL